MLGLASLVDCNCNAGKLWLGQLAAVIYSTVPSDLLSFLLGVRGVWVWLVCSNGTQIKALSVSKSKLVKEILLF